MNAFEKFCQETGIDWYEKVWAKDFYVAGLRRAVEIAKLYPGVYGNSPTAKEIEREAQEISEG